MTTYSISLDDVDLALLPIPSCSNNFLKKELYEFTVMKTEEDSSINELYHCHICAIDVPSAFSNAHNNGSKHQANVNIATEASKRMRELLTFNPPVADQSREKFCDPCSTIADDNHEKTKEHKVAVVHDRMLSELSNLYVGDCENETSDKSKIVVKSKEVNNNTKIVVGKVKRDDKSVANQHTQTIVDNAKVNDGDVKTATEYVRIAMNIYLKILKTVHVVPKLAVKGVNGNVQITVENVKLTVSSDQFHSFYRTGGEIMCLICNVLVKSGEEEIHKLVLAHMKVLLQVVDEHCIRKVNENWSHCILCNVNKANIRVEAHKATITHLEKQKESILSSHNIQLSDSEISEVKAITYPAVQNNIDNSPVLQENVKPPPNGAQNKLKPAVCIPKIDKVVLAPNQKIPIKSEVNVEVKKEPVKIITEIHSVFPVDERIEYPFEPKDQSSVNCKICSCIVPKSVNNRKDHLNGQRHAQNVKKHFPTLTEW